MSHASRKTVSGDDGLGDFLDGSMGSRWKMYAWFQEDVGV